MGSKVINSPYIVAFISGLVFSFGCELLVPLTEINESPSLFTLVLQLGGIILFFVIVQQGLQRFFGFQGFVISGDNGKGKRFPSYLRPLVGFFGSRFVVLMFTTLFFGALPN